MIDIDELRKRGYEEDSILLMLRQEFMDNYDPGPPDYDEDPQGWLDYYV